MNTNIKQMNQKYKIIFKILAITVIKLYLHELNETYKIFILPAR